MELSDNFWFDEPSILFNYDRLTEFFISSDQTTNEKLNSIARFGIYISVVLSMYNKDIKYLSLCILTFIITYFIYTNTQTNTNTNTNTSTNTKSDSKKEIVKSSLTNPFGNSSPIDIIDEPTRGPMSDYISYTKDALKEKEKVEENFGYNLFKEAGEDIYNKNNSQRMFYTTPSKGQIPPDPEGKFRDWLYGSLSDSNCKLNTFACAKNNNEDLRGYRQIFPDPDKEPSKI